MIISFDGQTAALVQAVSDLPVVTMCHFDGNQILNSYSSLEREALEKSAVVQVLMEEDVNIFVTRLPKAHVVYIPNIVPQYEGLDWQKDHKEHLIIDMARLEKKQKRQHLLIEAFAKVAKANPDWRLEFYGSEQGDHRYTDQLKDLVKTHHLEERVHFMGNVTNVLSVYRKAAIFGFPSASEGFPLAMTEAMSAGLPVAAYESCSAVNQLVQNGVNGFLVKDGVEPLADALSKLMKDAVLRENLGRHGREDMTSYGEKKVYDRWEILLEGIKENSLSPR